MSKQRSTRSNHNLVSPIEIPNQLLDGLSMTNDPSYQTVQPSKESPARRAETMAWWIEELERVDRR